MARPTVGSDHHHVVDGLAVSKAFDLIIDKPGNM